MGENSVNSNVVKSMNTMADQSSIYEQRPSRIGRENHGLLQEKSVEQKIEPRQSVQRVPRQSVENVLKQSIKRVPRQSVECVPRQSFECVPIQSVNRVPRQSVECVSRQSFELGPGDYQKESMAISHYDLPVKDRRDNSFEPSVEIRYGKTTTYQVRGEPRVSYRASQMRSSNSHVDLRESDHTQISQSQAPNRMYVSSYTPARYSQTRNTSTDYNKIYEQKEESQDGLSKNNEIEVQARNPLHSTGFRDYNKNKQAPGSILKTKRSNWCGC